MPEEEVIPMPLPSDLRGLRLRMEAAQPAVVNDARRWKTVWTTPVHADDSVADTAEYNEAAADNVGGEFFHDVFLFAVSIRRLVR